MASEVDEGLNENYYIVPGKCARSMCVCVDCGGEVCGNPCTRVLCFGAQYVRELCVVVWLAVGCVETRARLCCVLGPVGARTVCGCVVVCGTPCTRVFRWPSTVPASWGGWWWGRGTTLVSETSSSECTRVLCWVVVVPRTRTQVGENQPQLTLTAIP